jgi:hypothetical protein
MLNSEFAIKNLVELDGIFRKHNVRYWLQDGTLLGYYRDKNFISYDNDVDIGIRWADFSRETMLDIIANGFNFSACHGRLEESLVINVRKRGISIDIYFYYKDNDYFYHTAAYGKARKYRIDFVYKEFNVKEVEYFGHYFFVPEDEEYFVRTKYGDKWYIPDNTWDSNNDPLNKNPTSIVTTKAQSREAFKEWLDSSNL